MTGWEKLSSSVCQLAVTFVDQLSPEFYNVFKVFEWVSAHRNRKIRICENVSGKCQWAVGVACSWRCVLHMSRVLSVLWQQVSAFCPSIFSGSHFAVASRIFTDFPSISIRFLDFPPLSKQTSNGIFIWLGDYCDCPNKSQRQTLPFGRSQLIKRRVASPEDSHETAQNTKYEMILIFSDTSILHTYDVRIRMEEIHS